MKVWGYCEKFRHKVGLQGAKIKDKHLQTHENTFFLVKLGNVKATNHKHCVSPTSSMTERRVNAIGSRRLWRAGQKVSVSL